MEVNATLNNQDKFIYQFARQVEGKEMRCLNLQAVIFPEKAGAGQISYIKHSHFSFILSNVLLNEDLLYRSPDLELSRCDFVDFGIFENGEVESSFLMEQPAFALDVPRGSFKHLALNVPLELIPRNKSCAELLTHFRHFSNLPLVRARLKELLAVQGESVAQVIMLESKGLAFTSQLLQFLRENHQALDERGAVLSDYDRDCIARARCIVEDSFVNPPSIKQLSRQVGINEQKLKQGFKQLYNITIRQYVICLRMDKAKELLQQPGAPIGEVSYQVGYDHRGYFAKLFKRFHGVSPQVFKAQAQLLSVEKPSSVAC